MRKRIALIAGLFALAITPTASAYHPWNGYYWPHPNTPGVILGLSKANANARYSNYITNAANAWNSGQIYQWYQYSSYPTNPVRVESGAYGATNWLALTTLTFTTGTSKVLSAKVQFNDSYLLYWPYWTTAWWQQAFCHDLGHPMMLAHRDENFNNTNLGTCMDLAANPAASPVNLQPDQHDYDQIAFIASHNLSYRVALGSDHHVNRDWKIHRHSNGRSTVTVEHRAPFPVTGPRHNTAPPGLVPTKVDPMRAVTKP